MQSYGGYQCTTSYLESYNLGGKRGYGQVKEGKGNRKENVIISFYFLY